MGAGPGTAPGTALRGAAVRAPVSGGTVSVATSQQPARSGRQPVRSTEPVLITEAEPSLDDQHAARKKRYAKIGRHTSELQSRQYLVCRLLLEKKKNSTTAS